ncbi:MAG: 50S ribosomal protein L31 [Candidatus Pacebacteria bacterium]|nr:50S ribosomal protein L31 [Candidatus Paceibacterota bacterium]
MKSNVHPKWNHATTVTCGCGNTFQTGSVKDSIQVDVCSVCHPFYTGENRFVDTQGRVDRFITKRAAAQQNSQKSKKKADDKKKQDSLSFRDMLEAEKKKLPVSN